MASDLPAGCTEAMCDEPDPACGRCGHAWSDHLDEDEYVYDADGNVAEACNRKGCNDCDGFLDDEYIPAWQPDTYQEYYE
jgi:hypothetical protein